MNEDLNLLILQTVVLVDVMVDLLKLDKLFRPHITCDVIITWRQRTEELARDVCIDFSLVV